MERRAFLALIASAPIAALAPLPKFLPTTLSDPQSGISIRFIRKWEPAQRAVIQPEDMHAYWDYLAQQTRPAAGDGFSAAGAMV